MDTDEKFSYTFTNAGTYPYYCTIHPKMTGQVVVK
jgi:plastocyanin